MRILFALLLCVLLGACATTSRGDLVYTLQDDVEKVDLRLYNTPCQDAAITRMLVSNGLPPDRVSALKSGDGTYGGKPYTVCWVPLSNMIVFGWSDGTIGVMPTSAFKRAWSV